MHRGLRALTIAALVPLLAHADAHASRAATSRLTLQTFGYGVALDTRFAHSDPHMWGEDRLGHSSAQVTGGRFVVRVKAGYARDSEALATPDHSDGVIGAVVQVSGDGRAGVFGRWSADAQGHWSQYACWVDSYGNAGLVRASHDTFIEVASFYDHIIAGKDQGVALRVTGSRVDCYVNGVRIAHYHDPHPLAQGSWGAYTKSWGDPVQGSYARLLLAM